MVATMKSMILNLVLSLIMKLDDEGVFDTLKALVVRKLDARLTDAIEWLVREAEEKDIPGSEKKSMVLDRLYNPDSWWAPLVNDVSGRVLSWAIDSVVVIMKESK